MPDPKEKGSQLSSGKYKPPSEMAMREKPKLKNAKSALKRLCSYLLKKWPVLAIVFLASLVSTLISLAATRLNGYTIDVSIANRDVSGLLTVCLILAGMHLIGIVFTYTQNILMIRVAHRACADIRRDLFSNMQCLSLQYFDTHSSGDLMSRLTNDVDNINSAMSQSVVQLFTSVISIVGAMVAMLLLSPLLTLIALLTAVLTIFVSRTIIKAAQGFSCCSNERRAA